MYPTIQIREQKKRTNQYTYGRMYMTYESNKMPKSFK